MWGDYVYNVLLVEDDKNICEMIKDYFTEKSKNNIVLDIASDGQSGVEKAYENA